MKNPLQQLPEKSRATLASILLFFITSSAQTIYISSIEELQMIGNHSDYPLSGTYELTQDIDASATHSWTDNEGEGFRPIGTYSQTFIGVFDGKGHTVRNIYIHRPDQDDIGLFGAVASGGTIRNLGVISDSVSGNDHVSGLVGWMGAGAKIHNCFASCNVRGRYYVGGLVGSSTGGSIDSCYTVGWVKGTNIVGGFIGENQSTVVCCYSAVRVNSANSISGGFSGQEMGGEITASFWDRDISDQSVSAGGNGKSTSEMREQNTFSGWDFNSVWGINEGNHYPYLKTFPSITLNYLAGPNGNVSGSLMQTVNPGAALPVKATPQQNYHFVQWSDGLTYSLRRDHLADQDQQITAQFELDSYTLTYNPGLNGTIEGQTVQTVFHNFSAATITAVPNEGFYFVEWSDGFSEPSRTDVNVTGDIHVSVIWGCYISGIEALQKIGNDPSFPIDGHYKLQGDLDIAESRDLNGGQGFVPIGSNEKRFTGFFDGMGFTISGLHINRPDSNNVGLFGYIGMEGTVRDLVLQSDTVCGNMFTGGLAGVNAGTVLNCRVSGTVCGTSILGGLAGSNEGGMVISSSSSGRVEGGNIAGGLTGQNSGEVRSCYSVSDVKGITYIGGLIGSNSGNIHSCYTAGKTAGDTYVGGLCGSAEGTLQNCFSVSQVIGVFETGGLTGFSTDTQVNSCFWDTTASGLNRSSAGIARSTLEMTRTNNFTNWDFSQTWGICEENYYPYLRSFPVYTLSYTAGDGGSVHGSTLQMINPGAASPVSAVPEPNFQFVKWNDGEICTFRLDGAAAKDLTITAEFALEAHTITYTAGENGSITGQNIQRVAHGSDAQPVLAVPDEGFFFVRWSDGVETAERTDVNLQADTCFSVIWGMQISSFDELQRIGSDSSYPSQGIYRLGSDIDASPSRNPEYENGAGFRPIGSIQSPFNGSLDGRGFCIEHLFINRPGEDNVGLFGYVGQNGIVTGVTISADSIIGGVNVGGLAGLLSGTVDSCSFSGTVKGSNRTGGLVGKAAGGIISRCLSEGNAEADSYAGGLVGESLDSRITLSYSTSHTTASSFAGGLIGSSDNDSIDLCFSSGDVECSFICGGLAGSSSSTIINCYSVSYINGGEYAGGLVGNQAGSIRSCYSTGKVIGTANVGGLVGTDYYDNTVASFWDTISSGQSISAGGQGRSPDELKMQISYPTDTWDFADIWGINDSLYYPYLKAFPAFTMTYAAAENGTVVGPLTQTVNPGAALPVEAKPDTGYHFIHWCIDSAGARRCDRRITGDITTTASFAINMYTLTYSAAEHGHIEGDTLQTVQHGSDASEVWAVPEEGYQFVRWSDDVMENPRRDTDIECDANLTALFDVSTSVGQAPSEYPFNTRKKEQSSVPGGAEHSDQIEFTAGPNPVSLSRGRVDFFLTGPRLSGGVIAVYDASGNLIRKIRIPPEYRMQRKHRNIASWDLTTSRGKFVSSGVYKISGILTGEDKSGTKVSLLIAVRN